MFPTDSNRMEVKQKLKTQGTVPDYLLASLLGEN